MEGYERNYCGGKRKEETGHSIIVIGTSNALKGSFVAADNNKGGIAIDIFPSSEAAALIEQGLEDLSYDCDGIGMK